MQNKKINVLSYDIPFHRKTYDTLNLLKALGYADVSLWAFPLHYEKRQHSLIAHRPGDFCRTFGIPGTERQCRNFSYEYRRLTFDESESLEIDGGGCLLCVEQEYFLKNS